MSELSYNQPDQPYEQLDNLTKGLAHFIATGRLRQWISEETEAWKQWAMTLPQHARRGIDSLKPPQN